MDKFERVRKPREDSADDEIRITNQGRVATYVAYAARLFHNEGKDTITIRASGLAIPIAVSTVEILKRRVKGLHQQTDIGVTQLVEEFMPLEEGLERQTRTRTVPYVFVTLTRNVAEISLSAPGYQSPLDEALVRDLKELGHKDSLVHEGPAANGGRRRGGMRRAGLGPRMGGLFRGRGNYRIASLENEGASSQQGQRGRGRGGFRGGYRGAREAYSNPPENK